MNIQMIGIDHSRASVEYRERFSFTKMQQREIMRQLMRGAGVSGCVAVSTCNRTELYISAEDGAEPDLYGELCRVRETDPDEYRDLFVFRRGADAVRHLFYLAAGLESRVVGEDQILTQVGEALSRARESGTADKVLETLFRMAVTAGKKVKTQIVFPRGNVSAVHQALDQLREKGTALAGAKCMVIGNGEMGRLTALALRDEGADVTVTVRQYHSGEVRIPEGCGRIHYGERYAFLPQCSLVVSATASPNVTLRKDDLETEKLPAGIVFLDLAVPRDIDPQIGLLPGVTLYDIDDFCIDGRSEELRGQMAGAGEILEAGIGEFISWYECRGFVPLIRRISRAAAADAGWRMGKTFRQMDLSPEERSCLESSMEQVFAKVFDKLMFQLRDGAGTDVLRECLEVLSDVYPEV